MVQVDRPEMRTALNIMSLSMIAVLMVAVLSVHASGYDFAPADRVEVAP